MEQFHDWTWGCRDCCILHGLGSQRVAWEEKYQVLSSSLWGVVSCKGAATSLIPRVSTSSSVSVCLCHSVVLLDVKELPLRSSPECLSLSLSVSIFVCIRLPHSGVSSAVRELPLRLSPEWVCLCLHLSPSSPVSVYLCPRLSPSQCQVVGPEGVGCLSNVYIEGLETTVAYVF